MYSECLGNGGKVAGLFFVDLAMGKGWKWPSIRRCNGWGANEKKPNGLVYVLPFLNGFCREAWIYYMIFTIPSIPQKVSRVRSSLGL